MNNGNLRNIIVWVILAFSLLGLYNLVDNPIVTKNQTEISFSQLLAEVDAGNVVDVEIAGDNISDIILMEGLLKLLLLQIQPLLIDFIIEVFRFLPNPKKRVVQYF